jgi:hypothetical protein
LKIDNNIHKSVDWIRDLLANPSNYPDVLVIANHVNYLSDASWKMLLGDI